MAELKEIKIRKLSPECKLTVRIKTTKEFFLRLWLARNLIRLASFIMGSSAEFKKEVQ